MAWLAQRWQQLLLRLMLLRFQGYKLWVFHRCNNSNFEVMITAIKPLYADGLQITVI
jgi:hypothetical protein